MVFCKFGRCKKIRNKLNFRKEQEICAHRKSWFAPNMNMETNYIELAKHCIGIDRKKPYTRHGKKFYRPYRNYFTTGRNHDDWDLMVDSGYAKRDEEQNQHGGYTYWLTRNGLDWLGNELGITIYDESD